MLEKIYRFPWINIAVVFGITAFFLVQIPNVKLENDIVAFLPEKTPEKKALDQLGEEFTSYYVLDLIITHSYGSILDPEAMRSIRRITQILEEIPGIDSVNSLANVDYISGSDGTLTVMPLSEDEEGITLSPEEIIRRLNSWDLYSGMLVSADGHSTQIGISLSIRDSMEVREELYHRIREVAEGNLPNGCEFRIAGLPATSVQIAENMQKDLSLLIPFVLALVVTVLFFSFHRLGGVLLPLLTVIISTIWTLGLTVLLDKPLSILGSVIPVLMVAVGSAYGIHLISRYYDEMRVHELTNEDARRTLIVKVIRTVGVPIVMAGLTTVAGFGSLSVSTVVPMKIFGMFTAFGVATALLVALIFIPSLLIVLPTPARSKLRGNHHGRGLNSLAGFVNKHPWWIIGSAAVLLGASAAAIPRLNIDSNLTLLFKQGTEVRASEALVREKFSGTGSFSVMVSGVEPGTMNNPEAILFMEGLADCLENEFSGVGKIVTYGDFIKRINQVLHEEDPGRVDLAVSPKGGEGDSAGGSIGIPGSFDYAEDVTGKSDSFFDDSFDDDVLGGGTLLSGNPGESIDSYSVTSLPLSTPTSGENNSVLMEALWNAYLSNPDDFVEELARLTNCAGKDYQEIPTDPAKYGLADQSELQDLIAQFLLLYSGSLSEWSDEALEPTTARMNVQLLVTGSRYVDEMLPTIHGYADRFLPDGYQISIAGAALVQSALTRQIVHSMFLSIIISVAAVFIIIWATYQSFIAGIFGVIPLTVTVFVNFGIMGLTGIPLDLSTATMGSIGLGIGIDYTIHFLSSYIHNNRKGMAPDAVTAAAIESSGKAILFNAISVASGFAVLIFSRFNPLMYLGALIVLTMGVSSFASLTLLPALLNIFQPQFLCRNNTTDTCKEITA